MEGNIIATFVQFIGQVLSLALLARVVLSWVILSPPNPLVVFG